MLIFQIVFVVLFYFGTDEISKSLSQIFIYSAYMIISFGIVSICFKRFFKGVETELPQRNAPKKPWLFITGAVGIGYLTNLIINVLFSDFAQKYASETDATPKTALGIILLYISNALLPAILEEWAIRGVICKNLLPYSKNGAIVISALLFAILHIRPTTVIFTFVIGVLLAICYEYTGSLKLPMIIHFLNNALATTFSFFADDPNNVAMPFFAILIYAFMGLGIAAIYYYKKHGIAKKPVSLIKRNVNGYKLSLGKFFTISVINLGIIPLALMYCFYYLFLYSV